MKTSGKHPKGSRTRANGYQAKSGWPGAKGPEAFEQRFAMDPEYGKLEWVATTRLARSVVQD